MTPALAETTRAPRTAGSAGVWRGRAFGVNFEGDFKVAGVPPAPRARADTPTRLEQASSEDFDRAWSAARARRLEEALGRDGSVRFAIDHDDRLGYRLTTAEWGDYLVSADGRRVRCAGPLAEPSWPRQRYLASRVLPLAATIREREVFHASAVSLEDAAIAMVGPRHAGKTSLAVHLVLQGATLLTDDLLALEARQGRVWAHPGTTTVGIRQAEYRLIGARKRGRLGRFFESQTKHFAEVEREERELPLEIVFYLDRRPEISDLAIDELGHPDPRLLLASSFFNGIVDTPGRLRTQLELSSRLSRGATLCRVSVPATVGASALAEILAHYATARLGQRGRVS
jgi:hypothetical protein